MRKLLLCGFAVSMGLTAGAQSGVNRHAVKASRPVSDNGVSLIKTTPVAKKPAVTVTNNAISVIDLGQSANALTVAFGPRTFVWADKRINAITFSHRANSPSSGHLVYDFSKDGGATWTSNVGPVFSPGIGVGSNARYPQGVIYNPSGNTIADSAYFTYFAPTLTATNGSWGGFGYGTGKLGSTTSTQKEDTAKGVNQFLIPDHMCITQGGVTYVVDAASRFDNPSQTYPYTDTMIIATGSFNNVTKTMDYIYSNLYAPMSKDANGSNTGVSSWANAMGTNGLTGYIAIIGHNNFTFRPDSALYIILYKTSNAGINWSGPINIDVNAMAHPFLNDAGGMYSVAFDLDIAVDNNNNPHIFASLHVAGTNPWSVNTVPGKWGMFHIFSEDGGTTFKSRMVAQPMSFRGTFGDVNGTYSGEDNRPHISSTMDGTKMFLSYFDTDTVSYGPDNLYPDLHVIGYNTATKKYTVDSNFTKGTVADGGVTFGNVSYWVLEPAAGSYEVPVVFQALQDITNELATTQHKYIKGVVLNDADFIIGIGDASAVDFTVTPAYPNPFSDATAFDVNLNKASAVDITLFNTLGQVVMQRNTGKLSAGNHKIRMDGSSLSPGVYFCTVKAGERSVTNKIIVE